MFFEQIHRLLSFKKLLLLLLSLSVGIQIIIITYNNLSGYYVLDGVPHFIQRLLRGSLLSLLASILISYPDLFLIQFLNRKYPWGKSIVKRIPVQLGFTVLIATLIAILITAFANWIQVYTDHDIASIFITNI